MADKKTRDLVNIVFSELIVAFPAWRQAITGDVKAWEDTYKQQLIAAFMLYRIDSIEKLKRGLEVAQGIDSDFLPKARKFAKWCKLYAAPCHREFDDSRSLEQLASSPERRSEEIAKLKGIVAGAE